jgi:hypothetical protein
MKAPILLPRHPNKVLALNTDDDKELEQRSTIAVQGQNTLSTNVITLQKSRKGSVSSLTTEFVTHFSMTGGWGSQTRNQRTFGSMVKGYISGASSKELPEIMGPYKCSWLHIQVKNGKNKLGMKEKGLSIDVEKQGDLFSSEPITSLNLKNVSIRFNVNNIH